MSELKNAYRLPGLNLLDKPEPDCGYLRFIGNVLKKAFLGKCYVIGIQTTSRQAAICNKTIESAMYLSTCHSLFQQNSSCRISAQASDSDSQSS